MWKLKNQGPTAELLRMLRDLKWSVRVVFLLPLSLLAATIIASLEKTPLTGRWRVILLSPAEEEKIVETLQKTWRSSVNDVLASAVESGTPPAQIPITDWRHRWVEATLRRLENAVSLLQSEPTALLRRPTAKDDYPFPPPSTFPLAARPRPAQSAHEWMNPHHEVSTETNAAGESSKAVEHHNLNLIGPPYSCLVVDDPESQNAFSYGFGPGGAGGVVVFTGFLDEIMQNSSSSSSPHSSSQIVTPPPKSLLSLLFGSLSLTSQRLHEYRPTDKETSELAVLLSHELAHLILAHHLESLSATSILLPSITSILTDVSRAILFPFTWAFGPFINDVLIELGKRRAADARQIGTMKTGRVLEIEAGKSSLDSFPYWAWQSAIDLVSARLLAYAGFDPREAIKFWEARIERSKSNPENPKAVAGCAIQGDTDQVGWTTSTTSWAMGREVHPLNEERIKVLKDELERWEVEWTRLRKRGAVSWFHIRSLSWLALIANSRMCTLASKTVICTTLA